MIFHKHQPIPLLDKWVDCILYVEGNNKGIGFPKAAMSLVFNLDDSFRLYSDNTFSKFTDYKKHWIAGFQTGPSYVENYGESKMIVVQFKTAGAAVFLQQPLHSFTDNYIPLDCIFSNEADLTWERICEAATIDAKISVTEKFLSRHILQHKTNNEKFFYSFHTINGNRHQLTIEEVCRQNNISRKHLNFLFKENLGVSPKTIASLNRFQHILKVISNSKPGKLSGLAYELDYFDQAHFNNSFRQFTGLRPGDYLKKVGSHPSLRFMPHFLPVA
ncbi:MAG: AraC family transcriptional regulator [Chitinophagaceae bacterium]